MTATIKIVLLLQDLEFGGTQRYAVNLAKRMDRDQFDPEIWVLRGGDDLQPELTESGIPVYRMSQRLDAVRLKSLFNLWKTLWQRRPQILYTLTVVPNIWGRLFGRLTGIPVIISGYRSLLPKQKERLLWRFCQRLICNAEILKELAVTRFGVDPARVAVVPNGVDTDFFKPSLESKAPRPTVVSSGRLVWEKDYATLIQAFSLVKESIPDAVLYILGNGPLKPSLEKMVAERNLTSNVQLIPAQADIRPYLYQAWAFALSSASEASPNVVIESLAAGLPVVACRAGGIPELVTPGENGFLAETGDYQGLAQGLIAVLTDDELRNTMSRNGRERVLADHTLEVMVRRTEKIILHAWEETQPSSST
jgi:glycosyltransferase involved in cell wall biosynthesis